MISAACLALLTSVPPAAQAQEERRSLRLQVEVGVLTTVTMVIHG